MTAPGGNIVLYSDYPVLLCTGTIWGKKCIRTLFTRTEYYTDLSVHIYVCVCTLTLYFIRVYACSYPFGKRNKCCTFRKIKREKEYRRHRTSIACAHIHTLRSLQWRVNIYIYIHSAYKQRSIKKEKCRKNTVLDCTREFFRSGTRDGSAGSVGSMFTGEVRARGNEREIYFLTETQGDTNTRVRTYTFTHAYTCTHI